MSELLNARDVRAENEVEIEIRPGKHVVARKEDMTVLVFEGRVPMPMLTAVQKMIEMPNATPVERIEALGKENGQTLVNVLREHACKVVLKPKFVLEDDGSLDSLPVSYLDINELMMIWSATAVVPKIGAASAARFRARAAADDAPAVPAVEAVPAAAEPVGVRSEIEFVGQ